MDSNWAVVTVVTRNYLHFARALSASVRQVHPEAKVIACLVDEPPDGWQRTQEPFHVVLASELGISNWDKFLFQYTPFDLTCALKPFVLKHAFDTTGIGKLIYLDGDILVCSRLDELMAKLDSANVILTPHLTASRSLKEPDSWEVDLLDSGIFNGGFIGLRKTETARSMLDWWAARTRHWCKWNINHHDQGWLDAVPALFDGVLIERGAQYNAAIWNTDTRDFSEDAQGRVQVGGRPLAFFHFASLDPDRPDSLSRVARRSYDQEPVAVRRFAPGISGHIASLRHASKPRVGLPV
jgi:lipopolysaccharide biosynthesis glycosyltransferase